MNNQLTVIIPTSPIPSHPSTAIIDETIADIRRYTNARIIIMADGVHESVEHRSINYINYTEDVCRRIVADAYGVSEIIIFAEHKHQSEMTRLILRNIVKTPLIMFCEHDTSPIGDIPFQQICDLVQNSPITNCVRFNIFDRILEEHQHLMVRPYVENGIPLTGTIQYSQRPHIAKTDWYRNMLNKYFEPGRKTMIEDVMHSVVQVNTDINFGLAIYTPEGNQLRSYHSDGRGDDVKIIEG